MNEATLPHPPAMIRGPLALLCLVFALPILFLLRYLAIVGGAVMFWALGLRDGAQLVAATTLFSLLLLAGVYVLWKRQTLARWATAIIAALALYSGIVVPVVVFLA